MNIVVLRGRLSSAPHMRSLASGSALHSFEVTTNLDGRNASVPVVWFDPPNAPSLGTGDEVVVVGTVRRRFFRGEAGVQSRTEVVADEVVRAGRRARVQRLVQRAAGRLGEVAEGALRSAS